MKTTWKYRMASALTMGIAVACAQPKLESSQVTYQTQASQVLGAYAQGVSGNYAAGIVMKQTSAARALDIYSVTGNSLYATFNAQSNGVLINSSVDQEIQSCISQTQSVPQSCANYSFMVSTLSRCLNQISTYQNPINTFAYRNLSLSAQQNWTYLIDWREAEQVGSFGYSQYQAISPYAGLGYAATTIY